MRLRYLNDISSILRQIVTIRCNNRSVSTQVNDPSRRDKLVIYSILPSDLYAFMYGGRSSLDDQVGMSGIPTEPYNLKSGPTHKQRIHLTKSNLNQIKFDHQFPTRCDLGFRVNPNDWSKP